MDRNLHQKGAASIFLVIFAALLLTVLAVGFIRLMVQGQTEASNNDLSQSALDSALAGVEDAKRVIRACTDGNELACNALSDGDSCSVIAQSGIAGSPDTSETVVRTTSASGEEFNQAYTCVMIKMMTDDYLFKSGENQAEVIPLSAESDFSKIAIEWFTPEDAGSDRATRPGGAGGGVSDAQTLPRRSDWGVASPPVMRVQLISPGYHFSISDLDSSHASQTAFIRPVDMITSVGSVSPSVTMSPDTRARASVGDELDNILDTVPCSRDFVYEGEYSCRVVLDLGRLISVNDSKGAFLRLDTIYKGASVRVSLLGGADGDEAVRFDGVQPVVDSTGRANDLFRRVESRLKVGDDSVFPSYALDVEGHLCKDFSYSVVDGGTVGSCTP